MINNGNISWNNKFQPTVAFSTTETEYMTLFESTKEIIWLRQFLLDLGYQQKSATTIFMDNQNSISFAKNPIQHNRTKHIDIRHHFVREHIEKEDINVEFINTTEMIADIFTKALTTEKYKINVRKLGLKKLEWIC